MHLLYVKERCHVLYSKAAHLMSNVSSVQVPYHRPTLPCSPLPWSLHPVHRSRGTDTMASAGTALLRPTAISLP